MLAYPHVAVPPEVIGIPIGQGHENSGRWAEGRGANVLSILVDKKDAVTGALAWAATRVRVIRTGLNHELVKAEGTVPAFPVEAQFPIAVVRPGESAEDAIHAAEERHDQYANPDDE